MEKDHRRPGTSGKTTLEIQTEWFIPRQDQLFLSRRTVVLELTTDAGETLHRLSYGLCRRLKWGYLLERTA